MCISLLKVFSILFGRKIDFSKKKSSTTPDYPISALLSLKWSIASVWLYFRFFANLVKPSTSGDRTLY